MEKWLNSRLDKEIIEIPCYAIKLKKKPKNDSNMFKLHRNQFEGTLIGQIWDYVII